MSSREPASWSGLTPLAVSGKEEPTSVATEVKQRNNRVIVLVGVVIILPIILAYTALSYRVFRGKVRQGDEGYH